MTSRAHKMVALARAKIKEGAVPWSSTTNPESSNMDDVPWDMSPIPPPPSATEAIEEDLAFDANPALEIAVLETMEPKTGPELASQRLEAEPLPHQQHVVSTSSIPAETLNYVPGADQNKESSESSLRSGSASVSDSSSEELRHSQRLCPSLTPKAIRFLQQRNTTFFLCANDLEVTFVPST
ncbi:uncharacterized protein LOC125048219 [Penaeus chinensis]|uniref:uncharacterized protein LOC125048219 n=1 Tax=Penaeus chinensis TaxID=139456 RepID=UPI001FB58776|nr:uncharacterized protein LOC125048219 [Penaeus chinensis]